MTTLNFTVVTTRYLITDGNVVSPSGFHPSEPVFLTNKIMIQTDKLPDHVGEGLHVFDVRKNADNWPRMANFLNNKTREIL